MSLFSIAEKRAGLGDSPERWARDVLPSNRETAAGIDVGWDNARMLTAVYACQSLIADGIAALPVDVIKVDAKGRKKVATRPKWLDAPNPFETWFTFVHKLVISLVGTGGNAYILTVRNAAGVVQSVWVADPARCQVDEYSPNPIVYFDGEPYGPDELLHIPAFPIPGRRAGLSVIENARESIALGLAAEEFGARFFSQGTTMSGVIEHPGKASPGEVAIISKMMKKNAGTKNSHAIGMLSGGATFKPISVSPNEAQFLETRRFQAVQIATLYRVPPHMIDPSVQSSWGTGIEEQNSWFYTQTLTPWLVRLEQTFSRLLPYGQSIKWNLDAKLRAKTAERYEAYNKAIISGWLSPDDIRAKEDLEPIPNGHGAAYWMPANLFELGKPRPDPASASTTSQAEDSGSTGDPPKENG